MAANYARRTLQISSKTLLSCTSSSSSSSSTTFASKASRLSGLGLASAGPNSASRLSVHKRILSRLPVALSGVQQSLMPLHSVTASALLTSLLSVYNDNWGCLSEGFATTL
ncbi:hypothetical protein RGQ29_015552 [Quercus rubra]|uniref:Uncharacterized protein n=1 Tax=Quercus rubra TaxID=3512 RepID=A0AAN7FVI7_QUERU|nr:hypothetical protein RGQ29_015552 [Quercus rubra]